MEGNANVTSTASFMDAIEQSWATKKQGTDSKKDTQQTPLVEPEKESEEENQEQEEQDGEQPKAEETPSEDPNEQDEAQEDEQPEEKEDEEQEELPENATESARKAFKKLRDKVKELKNQVEESGKSKISDEDKSFLDKYKSKQDVIAKSLDIYELVSQWNANPVLGAQHIAQAFPDATKVILESAQLKKSTEQPTIVPASEEDIFASLGIDIGEIETEESPAIGKALRSFGKLVSDLTREVKSKDRIIEEKTNALKEEMNKKSADEKAASQSEKIKKAADEIKSGWRKRLDEIGVEAELNEKAVEKIWSLVRQSISTDYESGKFGSPESLSLQEMSEKVKIEEYITEVMDTFNIKVPEKKEKPIEKKDPKGTMSNLSKSKTVSRDAPEIKSSEDFMQHIQNKITK